MIEHGKISNLQLSVLIITYIIGTSIITVPSTVTITAKQDGWLSAILALGIGVLIAYINGVLAERYPSLTLPQTIEKILGKWLGIPISILYFLFFLLLTTTFLRVVGDLITTHILPETPIQAIEILFLLTIIMAVKLGLEPIGRTSEMLFPHIILFVLFAVLFLLPHIEIDNLTPVLENGMAPVFHGTFDILGAPYLNIIIFLMITPFVNERKKFTWNFVISTIIGGIIIIVITTLSISVLGADTTSRLNFAPFMLAQKIDIGNFIQRIEVISGGLIFITLFLKTVVSFFACTLSIAQTLRLNNYKILTFPLAFFVQAFSITFYPNIIYFHDFIIHVWTPFTFILGLVIPLLLLFVDFARSKFQKNKNQEVSNPVS
ncbi:GerAB/ArcD/ProY family transporter [Bacillus marasmi]|uniref:GerAB/ArcD/ProY family transporter n=1 Tax=Bacillus marasmi TaxID=1926279 RepID=UPI0011CB711D|nr:endospore germination permease [Bacillus marasmi]